MREAVLSDFFSGHLSVTELLADLVGTVTVRGDIHEHRISESEGSFEVVPAHLVRVCDAVLAGDLPPSTLEAIGFCLVASDYFKYDTDTQDGDLVAQTANEWSSPEINYPLTMENVVKFRERLITGVDAFDMCQEPPNQK
jgi:hypothetical protein